MCIHDSGAYCTAMYSMYNSRTPLPVYLYTRRRRSGDGGGGGGGGDVFEFTPIKVQTLDQCDQAYAVAAGHDACVLCEQFISGDEVTIAVLGALAVVAGCDNAPYTGATRFS